MIDGEREPLEFEGLSEKGKPRKVYWFSIAV